MKINRRDYLKGMGAAGMLAGVTGLEGLAHEYADPQRSCPADPACPRRTAPLVWEPRWCDPFPSNTNFVKLIFEGLMGIAPVRLSNGKVGCEVGFHSEGDGPIHHELEITAYSRVVDPDNCPAPETFERKKIEKVSLKVIDPLPGVAQTYFYQREPACTRRDLKYDEDFRWIVDFESEYLYRKHMPGTELTKKEDVYNPVLLVEYGIFYTLHKSACTFLARSDNNQFFIDLANVARIIGANIYAGSVEVTVNNLRPVPIHPPAEIYFRNHCKKGNGHCDFTPTHTDKKKRSDFFLNYKAFDRNDAPEYYLHLLESKDPRIPNVICERDRFTPTTEDKRRELLLNDESPCSAAGYGGGSKGLPPY
ncbi:MAG TPA: twin-arginine translocation signal domain-containing protein [Pyrinomonadaceae bacterium]|nr:twin-arginine translocation signal domain-containing protein [Pyrinomonadaceae bacterium]